MTSSSELNLMRAARGPNVSSSFNSYLVSAARGKRSKTHAVCGNIGQDGGLDIAKLAALAADKDFGSFRDGIFDVLDHLVGLATVDEGSVGDTLVESRANLELLDLGGQGLGVFVVDIGADYQYCAANRRIGAH